MKNHHRRYCNYEIEKALDIKIKTVRHNARKAETRVKKTNYTPFEIQKLLLDF